jgi:hypothetical protein
MADYNKLRRVHNLKKRAENRYKKAMKYGDGFHTDLYEGSEKDDEKMKRHMDRYNELTDKAKELFKETEEEKKKKNTPIKFVLPGSGGTWASYNQKTEEEEEEEVEEKEDNPFTYNEEMASFRMGRLKQQSTNQAFSSKDIDVITNLQEDYKSPSEGNFRTASQNVYASLDSPWEIFNTSPSSPLAFRGPNAAFRKAAMKSQAEISDHYSNFALRNESQALQNASTRQTMKLDKERHKWEKWKAIANTAGTFVGAVVKSDRRLKKDIKLIGLSPAGLKIYSFKYKNGEDSYQGVMSDEIPSDAVVKDTNGYDMVDYSKLDVEFKKI